MPAGNICKRQARKGPKRGVGLGPRRQAVTTDLLFSKDFGQLEENSNFGFFVFLSGFLLANIRDFL